LSADTARCHAVFKRFLIMLLYLAVSIMMMILFTGVNLDSLFHGVIPMFFNVVKDFDCV